MNGLSFVLALAAIALPVAWIVGVGSLSALPLARRLPPVARGELSAWMALLPAIVAVLVVAAVSTPSVRFGLGWGPDHCLGHEHHPHVCAWHGAVLPPGLAWVGAVAWAASAVRLGQVLAGVVRAERLGAALAALGVESDGVHRVPSSVAVCHALGVLRTRIVVSDVVVDALGEGELEAVVAHERAHVDRADPRWSAALAVVGSLSPLTHRRWSSVWREAAEEVADDVAAGVSGGLTVAAALVSVARVRLAFPPGLAFGAAHLGASPGTHLERRVARLLHHRPSPRPHRTAVGALVMASLGALVVAVAHEPLHHLVEQGWELAVRHHR